MNRGNLVALLLVVGLGAFFYLHDVKGKPIAAQQEKQQKRYFPDLAKKDIASLKIEKFGTPAFTHEMSKENGVWILQGAEPVVLRTSSTGQAVKALVELQKAEDAGDVSSKPEDFGLDKPSYKITLKDRKGVDHALLLGAKTPDDSGYYVTPGPGKPITTIATSLTELLDPATDNQREMSPLTFEPSTANKILIESASGPPIELALTKPREDSGEEIENDEGMSIQDLSEEWKIVRPEAASADAAKVRDMLFNWRNVKVGRFMKASEKAGFEPSTVKLTVFVDRQSKPFVLDVGQAVPGKPGLYYARRTPPNEQMVLEVKDFKLLEPKVAGLLQRHLYVFQPEEADRLEATIDTFKTEAVKRDDLWNVSMPKVAKDKEDAQKTAVADLVWELKNLEWSSKPDAKAIGAWKERASLEVWDSAKKSLAKISLGQPGPGGQGAYVKDGAGVVYLVEKDPYQRLMDIKLRLEGKGPAATPAPKQEPFVIPGKP
ncbi:MAG: DUF4340 domain-containing protein [Candidatus Eremiobacteraeota bacterium]|nr:DUF4340 domain-containing protein [Candidatus Eremiobacteraeota bacterium]